MRARPAGRTADARADHLSRQAVWAALDRAGTPMAWDALASRLGATAQADRRVLRARLDAMVEQGLVVRNRRGELALAARMDLVRGRIVAHRDGYGFVVPDHGGPDLYLAPREMRSLLHGDRVLARVKRVDRQGRGEAALVEVLERNTTTVVGRFFADRGLGFVVPDNKRLHQEVLVPDRLRGPARDGAIVVAEILEQPSQHSQPIGRVVEVLGGELEPRLEIEIAIRSFGIPFEWPAAVEAEASRLPASLGSGTGVQDGRVDLRDLPFVTIDGADAKDFDDAVYCERRPHGWLLQVAIADVSSYVEPGTALDEEARRRGTSVYFPERVIPMLPERLSNGICSLNPNTDRLVLVCQLAVDRRGRLTRSRFVRGVIRSRKRLVYDDVAAALVQGDQSARAVLGDLLVHLEELHALFRVLKAARRRRGAIEFETVEPRIVFERAGGAAGGGRVVAIESSARTVAHEIIEECMIAANVCAARFLTRNRLPGLYRVHDGPGEEKLAELRLMLGEIGLRLGGGESVRPGHYSALLARAADRPDARMVHTALLRSLAQAVYRPSNAGHFGLALERYAHFTSPIRRYPDLVVHRQIRHFLRTGARAGTPHSGEDLLALGEHTSMTERRAEEAVRDAVARLKCEFMREKVGEEFSGYVSGVTSFGVFVALEQHPVDGLVHVSGLGEDFFHFDPVRHRLEGERTGKVYRLGEPLAVRLVRVDAEERKIDFELARAPGRDRSSSTRKRRRGRGR